MRYAALYQPVSTFVRRMPSRTVSMYQVQIQDDHEDAEGDGRPLQLGPDHAIEGEPDRPHLHANEHRRQDERDDAGPQEGEGEPLQTRPGRQGATPEHDQQQAIQTDDQALPLESLQPLEDPANGEQIRADGRRAAQQIAGQSYVRCGAQEGRHQCEHEQSHGGPDQLQPERVGQHRSGAAAIPRHGADGNLTETEVHQGFEDGG